MPLPGVGGSTNKGGIGYTGTGIDGGGSKRGAGAGDGKTSSAGGNVGTGGGGSLVDMKSVISIQSKRLAEDVNHVYDSQILFTTKIQFQRGRIEDLTFRIAKAEKELVSFVSAEGTRCSLGPGRCVGK